MRIRALLFVARMRRAGFQAVELGHADVHQDHGWVKACCLGDSVEPVECLGHDLDVVFVAEQHPEAGADHRLVVGDEDADFHGRSCATGRRVLRMKPRPFAVPALISPP